MRPSQLELNPSLNSHPDPWDSQRVSVRMAQPQLMNQNYTRARERSRQSGPLTYWDTHTSRSDLDSSNGRHVPDSGYYTQTHGTASIYSGEMTSNHECQSLTGGITETEVPREGMAYGTMYPEPPMSSHIQYPEEPQSEYPFELICQICEAKSKNRSEYTYVYNLEL